MKKSYWILLLVVVIFLGDRMGGLILNTLNLKSQFRYSRLYNGNAEADILLIGNSRGLIFYQPFIEKLTGKSTFNFSYNALPMDLGFTLIKDYYRNYKAPEKILIDVTMCDRINTQLISSFSPYRSESNSLTELIEQEVPKTYYGGIFSNLFRFNSEIFHRALYYLNKSDEDWLLDRVMSESLRASLETIDTEPFKIDSSAVDHLKKTIDFVEGEGTEVILLVNPYYPDYREKMIDFDEQLMFIEKVTNKNIADYSQIELEEASYGDFQHLNKNGSQKYLELLFKHGILE